MKLVSVVIPCFNRIELLEIALDSIRKQTYSNVEIIIIDDNSENNLIEKLALLFNYKYIRNQINLGAQKSRNIGVHISSGEYIAFMDSDDIWIDTTKLEKQIQILDSMPNFSLVFTHLQYIDYHGKILMELNDKSDAPIKDFKRCILCKDMIGTYSSVMVRKIDLISVGMCSENLPARQDWDLWIKLSVLGKAFCLGSVSIQYRIHHEQISSNSAKKIEGYVSLLVKHRNKFNSLSGYFSLFIHQLKIIISVYMYRLDGKYFLRLRNLHSAIFFFAFFTVLPVYVATKFPIIGPIIIKKLSNTYLLKGLK